MYVGKSSGSCGASTRIYIKLRKIGVSPSSGATRHTGLKGNMKKFYLKALEAKEII